VRRGLLLTDYFTGKSTRAPIRRRSRAFQMHSVTQVSASRQARPRSCARSSQTCASGCEYPRVRKGKSAAVAAGIHHINTSNSYGPHVTNQIIPTAASPLSRWTGDNHQSRSSAPRPRLAARGNSKCFREAAGALKRRRAKRRYNALLAHGWTLGYRRDRCRNRLVGPGATITTGC
jgi:hypothetical protein